MRGAILLILTGALSSATADEAGVEFFEKRIRPVLVEHCYECHNSQNKTEGGLALDHRAAVLEGGNTGPAVVPERPDDSLLLKALRHQQGAPRMPKGNAKLSEAVVADFARWVRLGAPDPRDKPPAAEELHALTSWESIRDRRKQWWSFQPVQTPVLPQERRQDWPDHPLDRFLWARMKQDGLEPAPRADRRTLIRRVSFALTGLPPTPEETERFLHETSPRAYDDLVDGLLQSPRFGERWARHWMDWLRFAESHGSEGDPAIPHAWRYRDYLIRALNDDVPYDRLVLEQIAGDLLPDPRINQELGLNESALGIGHLRMVPHGYAPTDALDEQVTFTDNQIDVLSKAFLGLTVSCARCHNHKFDPIGQTDFYAFYGILASSRPALITVDAPERSRAQRAELQRLRGEIRRKLADAWTRSLDTFPKKLQEVAASDEAAKDPGHPLHAWALLRGQEDAAFARTWAGLQGKKADRPGAAPPLQWDLTGKDHDAWFKHGNGLPERPTPPGEFHVADRGETVIANIYPAGIYTHLISDKHNGVLTSPRFKIETDAISVRVAGGSGARVRLAVQNYPRVPGLLYPAHDLQSETMRWVRWDTRYWKGEWAYIEVATAEDLPIEVKPNEGRSWFGIAAVVGSGQAWQPPSPSPLPTALDGAMPRSPAELAALYAEALRASLNAWTKGAQTDAQAELLGAVVRGGLLPNTLHELPALAPLVAEYRRREAEVPVPTRAPGVLEGTPFDQPLFVRGNIKAPGAPVPRRFLEVFDARPYETHASGRRELAGDIADPRNPLTARVLVNRLWHHLFGRGIVSTTDNFGHLGDMPSDPELLDYLAARFVADGWSIKRMVRLIVTSRTYQLETHASKATTERDPANLRLARFPIRRLEGEAIRDAILAVSGRLDETRYGPSVSGRTRRRSVYVRVQRNDLDPFLNVFDVPEPLTARGRRDSTNVPAQSLTLLNDPWVSEQARAWAETVARDPALSDADGRIGRMFETALGRPPTDAELAQSRRFLADQEEDRAQVARKRARLESALGVSERRLDALTSPVRDRLSAERRSRGRDAETPTPMARWEFDGDFRDSLGGLHGEPKGNARLDGGALVLDGKSYVQTTPLARLLKAKTLEAWVRLDGLDQRGGGVVGVESLDGGLFDTIVYGEQAPREWIAGSNFFARTQPFHGPPETAGAGRTVHFALVYRSDGAITGYRDGAPYGQGYRSNGPITFEVDKSHVVFGLRHSSAGGNKMWRGQLLRAQLYDRALSAEEVAASAASIVPEAEVLAALSATKREECTRLQGEIDHLTATLRTLDSTGEGSNDPSARWQDLAHALLNLKEFLYVR